MKTKTLIIAAVLTFGLGTWGLKLGTWGLGLQTCSAQNIGINTTGATPNSRAILDIDANGAGLGLLIPRMTTAVRDTIGTAGPTIPTSLIIYNTTDNCLQIYIGTAWQSIYCGCIGVPTAVTASASPNPICAGSTLTLTGGATGATSWSWTGPNGFTSTLQSPTIANITTAGAGVYTLTASNFCGLAAPANTASVTVNGGGSPIVFSYTGAMQTWPVPVCVTSITIEAFGAQGEDGGYPGIDDGGYGGYASATIAVTSTDILYVFVGGRGGPSGGTPGWNGGGAGGWQNAGEMGGGGGGASDARLNGSALGDRVIVAGGGGGGGTYYCGGGYSGAGGTGGGLNGSVGINGQNGGTGGGGGTQSGGGAAGSPSGNPGSLGQGGTGANGGADASGGGGGGGYYGGGGGGRNDDCLGAGAGGGGGSGFGTTLTNGVQSGNGQVTITW